MRQKKFYTLLTALTTPPALHTDPHFALVTVNIDFVESVCIGKAPKGSPMAVYSEDWCRVVMADGGGYYVPAPHWCVTLLLNGGNSATYESYHRRIPKDQVIIGSQQMPDLPHDAQPHVPHAGDVFGQLLQRAFSSDGGKSDD